MRRVAAVSPPCRRRTGCYCTWQALRSACRGALGFLENSPQDSLSCACVVPVGGSHVATRQLWLQEFCNGGSLRTAIARGYFRTRHLPQRWRPIMSVLRDVCAGMGYMHEKRICHGDLTPANILLQVRLPAITCMTHMHWASTCGHMFPTNQCKLLR